MFSSSCCLQTKKKDCREVCACNCCLNEPSSQCVLGGYHPSLIKPYIFSRQRYKYWMPKKVLRLHVSVHFSKDPNCSLVTLGGHSLESWFLDPCLSCQDGQVNLRPSFISGSLFAWEKSSCTSWTWIVSSFPPPFMHITNKSILISALLSERLTHL